MMKVTDTDELKMENLMNLISIVIVHPKQVTSRNQPLKTSEFDSFIPLELIFHSRRTNIAWFPNIINKNLSSHFQEDYLMQSK